jgi:PPK2 family polyphosphate:nucleotide phosphotransferase
MTRRRPPGGLFESHRIRVDHPRSFRLSERDTGDTRPFKDRASAEGYLQRGIERLAELQDRLYAQDRWSVLLIIQAMDAAGKDGIVKHVMSGLNPQGCDVVPFKTPTSAELDHDFLWRSNIRIPERGRIGVFNRSYYEEVLVVRVHPEILASQRIPDELVTGSIWRDRFEDINANERYLSRNGIKIVKVYLHVSKEEQLERLLARLDDPEKNWKFSTADLKERSRWNDYRKAYQEMIAATSTRWAPWHVVPADHKWFARLAVADLLIEAMESLDLHYPGVTAEKRKELALVRKELAAEQSPKRRRR